MLNVVLLVLSNQTFPRLCCIILLILHPQDFDGIQFYLNDPHNFYIIYSYFFLNTVFKEYLNIVF